MPITAEARAEINRQNARKSTGPRTEEGKAASRGNALKHGLAATTIEPVAAPGEPAGAYQERLDAWVADTGPRNVLEMAMIARACRASWKLDRCARYEDAAAARRQANPPPDRASRRQEAHQLGALLMFALDYPGHDGFDDPPPTEPDPFDDPPRHADELATFREGVEWLLASWAGVLPALADGDDPAPEGSDAFVRRSRHRALRLLGVPACAPPAQPLREAGEAEVRRLRGLLAGMASHPSGRTDADLALFECGPEAQLLMRYEAQAERELHRAVGTFLKLRKDPDLVPPPEPEAEAVAVAEPAAPVLPAPAPAPAPSAPNEPTSPAPAAPSAPTRRPRRGAKGPAQGRLDVDIE